METLKSWLCKIGSWMGLPCGPTPLPPPSSLPPKWPWRAVDCENSGVNGATPDTLNQLQATLGPKLNTVRLGASLRSLTRDGSTLSVDQLVVQGLAWLDSMLDRAAELGLQCWILWDDFPTPDGSGWISPYGTDWWNDPTQVAQIIPMAQKVAAHFQGRGAELCAYSFIMEPRATDATGKTIVPPQWPALQKQIIEAVQALDPKRYLLAQPGPGCRATNYTEAFTPLPYDRLLYDFEHYFKPAYCYQGIKHGGPFPTPYPGPRSIKNYLAAARAWSDKHGVTMFCSEFSCAIWAPDSNSGWMADTVALFEEYGWGWSYHCIGSRSPAWNMDYDSAGPGKRTLKGPESARWQALAGIFAGLS